MFRFLGPPQHLNKVVVLVENLRSSEATKLRENTFKPERGYVDDHGYSLGLVKERASIHLIHGDMHGHPKVGRAKSK